MLRPNARQIRPGGLQLLLQISDFARLIVLNRLVTATGKQNQNQKSSGPHISQLPRAAHPRQEILHQIVLRLIHQGLHCEGVAKPDQRQQHENHDRR